ncbi:MAG: hypothetical protein AAF517_05825 [Planctomycetota bacterium]
MFPLSLLRGSETEAGIVKAWNEGQSLDWKKNALSVLGFLRATTEPARELVRRCLESEELASRAAVASRFLGADYPVARRLIESHSPEESWKVDSAEFLLRSVGPDSSADVPWLIDVLRARTHNRELAAVALKRIGAEAAAAAPVLSKLVRDRTIHWDVRIACGCALSCLDSSEEARRLSWELFLEGKRLESESGLRMDVSGLIAGLEGAGAARHGLRTEEWLETRREWGSQTIPGDLADVVRGDPSIVTRLPERFRWLPAWVSGSARDRSLVVKRLQRRLAIRPENSPRLSIGRDRDEDHHLRQFQLFLQLPGLLRELRSVWRQWADLDHLEPEIQFTDGSETVPPLYAAGLLALWKSGEPFDVRRMREIQDRRDRIVAVHERRSVEGWLYLVARVGKDAEALRPLVEEIHDRTQHFDEFRLAQRALDAIDGKR